MKFFFFIYLFIYFLLRNTKISPHQTTKIFKIQPHTHFQKYQVHNMIEVMGEVTNISSMARVNHVGDKRKLKGYD